MIVEPQVVVRGADVLVGVPCYRDGSMVKRCLDTLAEPGVQLLLVDNGADADVRRELDGRGIVIRNETNVYVNPAWNQMMRLFLMDGRYKLLVLANSDLVMDSGWAAKLRARLPAAPDQLIFGVDKFRQRATQGEFFALSPRAVAASCPIPDDLLVLGGDDFIFTVSRGVGCVKHVIEDLTLEHVERGTYDKAPEVWSLAHRDTDRWRDYVEPELVPQRIAEFLRAP